MSHAWMDSSAARRAGRLVIAASLSFGLGLAGGVAPASAQNEIVTENQLPGSPPAVWDVSGAGDPTIQGFATDISVDQGETIEFKIDTDATAYHLEIYRLGWYGGDGARRVDPLDIVPTATLPQVQPAPLYDAITGLTDCGNWAVSASWAVPANAVSGIYLARLVRHDTNGASHVIFIVRDDDGASDLLFQTADATWQAYNTYGNNSLYVGAGLPNGHASKVSYNRPFITRGGPLEDWVFNAEFPMLRWLERNGYDVSYTTNIDTERLGAEILEHRVFLSVGHDEYWSAGMRASVTAARDAGVHLAFFSGNEVYWKTRYEPSNDGTNTPYRTLVCYKEGSLGELACAGKCDPLATTWTGLWRDGCSFTPPADGCAPENALTGQISWVGTTGTIEVPGAYRDHRFWRDTAVAALAPGSTLALAPSSLGYEWDQEQYAASYPPGRVRLSNTSMSGQTHHLSLYRAPSGALVFGAGTVQWSWGLDGTHDRGSSTPHTAMRQATVNLFADMGVQPATLMATLVAATPVADAVAPVSTIGFPLEGSTIPGGVTLTISGTSFEADGVVAGVEVSTDGGTTWTVGQGGANWSFAWTPAAAGPATILVRAVDDVGNLEAPDTPGSPLSVVHVTVSGPTASNCPCTIWPADVVAGPDGGDGGANELGVKFRSDEAGLVTGARFYKHTDSGGPHVAHLWTGTGTLLATATYATSPGTGWREVAFDPPVAIAANTTYVVSTFMPTGHYAFTANYFTNSGQDRPPLHALQSGIDGLNGVYRAGSTGFPTSSYNDANYWVDVVFDTEGGPDTGPPIVTGIVPGSGATAVAVTATVRATFSEPIDPLTLDGTTVQLRDPLSALVAATVTYDGPTRVVTLTPSSPLLHATTYTARLVGGGGDPRIKDLAGNALAANLEWSFTTVSPPAAPPDEGPGGPILVVTGAANPIGRFLCEILRTEGLNEFTATDLSMMTPALLAAHDVVILGDTPVSVGEAAMLAAWVDAGGNLVAMRPHANLLPLCGVTAAGGTLSDRSLLIATASGPGVGLVAQPIQFHGTADLYTLAGATAVATLYSDAVTPAPGSPPAVTMRAVGVNGGHVVAFAYDLARSVVQTRQGNPAWAGQERDGTPPRRSDDMFFGGTEDDWVDLDRVAIPQADEQQRLLANLVHATNLDRNPLPRFWYFPRGKKAVVLMTGDDHGNGGTVGRMNQYIGLSPGGCSVPDWECVRSSSYIYPGTPISDAQALAFEAAGFEIGTHVNTGCADWTEASLDQAYGEQIAGVAVQLPSIARPVSNRTHCIAWSEWATQARVALAHGIRLDTNYYYWPAGWVLNRPGFFTGSGMPMRFADLDGTMIDCYQAATQLTDESGQDLSFTIDALLDKATGPEGYYGVFTANMHTDSPGSSGSDAIVASALSRGVPVVSGRQLLTWLDARNGSSFDDVTWSAGTLGFTMDVDPAALNLRAMLPRVSGAGTLVALERDGNPVAWTSETIKGVEYAFFPAADGGWEATYAPDTTPPAISNVVATPHGDGTATITWTTDDLGDSRVDFGTDAGALTDMEASAAPVTSHSLVLSGLLANTTYHLRVRSADAIGNASIEPNPPAAPLSFTMPPPTCFVDATGADFAQGTTDAGTAHAAMADGEVILAPTAGSDFPGTALPAGWSATTWAAGGAATVGGGTLTLDAVRVGTDALYTPGRTLEFVATFGGDANQHIGFGFDYNGAPWAMFSTGAGGGLKARTDNAIESPTIPGSWLGAPHHYRIDWLPGEVVYFIDGVEVARHARDITASMRPLASDFVLGGGAGGTAVVHWMRVTPYAGSGMFLSRVHDGTGPTQWGTAAWTADTPAGTSVALAVRSGNVPAPDGSWTAFVPVAVNGGQIAMNSRYVQYRAQLATTDPAVTPVLRDVTITCESGEDDDPPVITNVAAAVDGGGTSAQVTWDTDEPATSRVDYGTSPGTLGQDSSDGSFVAVHARTLSPLLPATTYYYRVTSVDASTNAATSPVPPDPPLSFTTPAAPCGVDDLVGDFLAGTTSGGTFVSLVGDGEVTLAPALGSDFAGSTLPADWASFSWTGGGSTAVAAGQIHVDGMRANSVPGPGFMPGRSLEFVATFAAAPFQHVGFGGGDDTGGGQIWNAPPWVMFSTGNGGTTILARTADGASTQDFPVPGGAALLGTPHRYRIDWTATGADYYVDGVFVVSHTATLPGPLRPAISDYSAGGAEVAVDLVRLTPYASPGTFDSRVHDAGAAVQWIAMSWGATTPAGTAIAMSARGGDDPDPNHASWSAFEPIASSGAAVGFCSRYLQYRAVLTTTDPSATPALEDVTITCAPTAAPAAIADLACTRAPGAPDASGRLRLAVTWSTPGGGGPVRVYRKGWGDHPLYRVGVGAPPVAPASPAQAALDGWTLTALTATGEEDLPPSRDSWSYVAFNTNECGAASPVSNLTEGTLDYVLGDFSNGLAACAGDNAVDTADLTLLGIHYGEAIAGPADPNACIDIGPTVGYSTTGRPLPDGVLEFEDLVLCALNYTGPGSEPLPLATAGAGTRIAGAQSDAVRLEATTIAAGEIGERFVVPLWASGSGRIHAVQLELAYDPAVLAIEGVEAGALLAAQAARPVVLTPRPGRVDIALLGRGVGLTGEGELVRVLCRRIAAGDPGLSLARIEARDGANRTVALEGATPRETDVPSVTHLAPARPNPSRGTVSLSFGLAEAGPVDLALFSVDGRRVRTLARGPHAAGTYAFAWDGRNDDGNAVSAGMYYVRLVSGDGRRTRTVMILR